MDNFLEIKKSLEKLNCEVYPGIELSLEEGHVNIVFDPYDAENLSTFPSWIERNKTDSKSNITTDMNINNMKNWENGIYILNWEKVIR